MNNLMKVSIATRLNLARHLFQFLSIVFLMLVASSTYAAVTSLKVSPSNKLIIKDQNASVNLRWQIATDPNHTSGIASSNARIINPQNGEVLNVYGSVLSANGAGPFSFIETLTLPEVDTNLWFTQGLKSVVVKRTFSGPAGGSGKDAQMILQLSNSSLSASRESTSGELNILNLKFEFENGTVLAQVEQDSSLQGTLTLQYTGTGLLEGRWLIAEPAGSYDEPLYRTLALIKKNINGNQRSTFKSPELPTTSTGKYLLRFCVTNRSMRSENVRSTEVCSSEELMSNAAYLVRGTSAKLMHISGIQPDQQSVNPSTTFSWNPLAQARVYQIQFFELLPTKASLASSRDPAETVQPEFLVGMMLQGNTTQTPLSELVLSKLQSGKHYLWRVTAHNQLGHVLGSSPEATFHYQADAAKDKPGAKQ